MAELARQPDAEMVDPLEWDEQSMEDDRLRLIFTCCHPALSPDAQIALTLREVCGLTTEEIARAFLTAAPTIAKRIVRAKAKIRDARIPYEVPSRSDLPARLESVLQAIYLVFTEGYAASSGESLTRPDLSGEAIRLGRLLVELLPEPEAQGLLALMLLHESRRSARTSSTGDLVLLDDQDRSLWNRNLIDDGSFVGRASAGVAACRPLHVAGGDRGGTCWCIYRGRDGLEPDRRTVRRAPASESLASRGTKPRRGGRHARWSSGWPRSHRRDPGARRPRELPSRPFGPGRSMPAVRAKGGSSRIL